MKKTWLIIKMIFSYSSLQTSPYSFFFWLKYLFKAILFLGIFSFGI